MGALVWLGFLAFFFASLTVGIRLILLWTRTRELPELLIGLGVLGIGPVGFGCQRVGQVILNNARAESPEAGFPTAASWLIIIGGATAVLGVACKLVFNGRVYHADSSWVQRGVIAGVVSVFALLAYRIATGDTPAAGTTLLGNVQSFAQIGVLLWGSAEALVYWRRMKRRSLIGLADPAVTNRFLLWGIGAGAAGLGSLIGTITALVVGQGSAEIPWVVMSSSLHGLVAAIALSLAFVPPAGYLRWVRRGAVSAQG
jgi:hypothetical protein